MASKNSTSMSLGGAGAHRKTSGARFSSILGMKVEFLTIKVWIQGVWIWDEFHLPYFQQKNRWIPRYVFLPVYGIWISDEGQMNSEVCFFICLWGMNFWWKTDGFQGMFFICLQGTNFSWKTDGFQGMFFICLQGTNFGRTLQLWAYICMLLVGWLRP